MYTSTLTHCTTRRFTLSLQLLVLVLGFALALSTAVYNMRLYVVSYFTIVTVLLCFMGEYFVKASYYFHKADATSTSWGKGFAVS